jgi:hypothetical protein
MIRLEKCLSPSLSQLVFIVLIRLSFFFSVDNVIERAVKEVKLIPSVTLHLYSHTKEKEKKRKEKNVWCIW